MKVAVEEGGGGAWSGGEEDDDDRPLKMGEVGDVPKIFPCFFRLLLSARLVVEFGGRRGIGVRGS